MDLNCFFEALEELANRLYNNQDPFDNLQQVVDVIKRHVTPAHSGAREVNVPTK